MILAHLRMDERKNTDICLHACALLFSLLWHFKHFCFLYAPIQLPVFIIIIIFFFRKKKDLCSFPIFSLRFFFSWGGFFSLPSSSIFYLLCTYTICVLLARKQALCSIVTDVLILCNLLPRVLQVNLFNHNYFLSVWLHFYGLVCPIEVRMCVVVVQADVIKYMLFSVQLLLCFLVPSLPFPLYFSVCESQLWN